jgi:hypothetical protein
MWNKRLAGNPRCQGATVPRLSVKPPICTLGRVGAGQRPTLNQIAGIQNSCLRSGLVAFNNVRKVGRVCERTVFLEALTLYLGSLGRITA